MAIDAGDVVLTFLGDTTQLDSAFQSVNDQTKNLTEGFSGFNTVLDQTRDEWDGLSPKAKAYGTDAEDALDKTTTGSREAAAEVGLLGEMFGGRLPRHVRTFIGEIDLIAPALEAAFSATAVLFIIDAIAKLVEKVDGWLESTEKIKQAWENYAQTVADSSQKMQQAIDAQSQKLIEMREGPVAALDFAMQHMQTQAMQTFDTMSKNMGAAIQAMTTQATSFLPTFMEPFKQSSADLQKFQRQVHDAMAEAARQHPEDAMAAYQAGLELVSAKEQQLTKDIKTRSEMIHEMDKTAKADSADVVASLHAERQAVNDLFPLLQAGITLEQQQRDVLKQQRTDAQASRDEHAEQTQLQGQITAIETWLEKQHAAYLAETIDVATYKANELQAQQAITIAREDALRQQIATYTQAGEVYKAQEAQQKLNIMLAQDQEKQLKSFNAEIEKHHQAVIKITGDYMKLTEAAIDKQWKADSEAAAKLAQEEDKLAASQEKLNQTALAATYKQQEEAINHLAQVGLITEQQKQQKLEDLYQQEKKDALDVLQTLLDQEQAEIKKYQTQIAAAQGNPLFTKAMLDDLQTKLDKAQVAYNNATNQFIKLQEQYDSKIKSSQKTSHGYWQQMIQDMDEGVNGMVQLKNMGEQTFDDLTKAFESSISAAILGTSSFGQAMEKATAQVLASLAAQALVKALFYTAEGVAHLAMLDFTGAAQYFEAAGLMGAVGGAAAAGAHFMSGGAATTTKTGAASTTTTKPTPGTTSQLPVTTVPVNVPQLQSGGLVTGPTIALLGEMGASSQQEGIIPLGDPRALMLIGRAIAAHIPQAGAPQAVTVTLETDIAQTIKRINNSVSTGRARLLSTDSMRTTRRSV